MAQRATRSVNPFRWAGPQEGREMPGLSGRCRSYGRRAAIFKGGRGIETGPSSARVGSTCRADFGRKRTGEYWRVCSAATDARKP